MTEKPKDREKAGNPVADKSFTYAVRVVRLCRVLQSQREFILARQLLKSGTSIGANVEEALGAISRREFAAKIGIAYKEARESDYWLRLLKTTDCLSAKDIGSLQSDTQELLRILGSILITARRPQPSPN